MNFPSRHGQQQHQKQKALRMQKHENSLEFHSRLIEAAEVRLLLPFPTNKAFLRG
jgi:hypothetical protein